MSNQNPDSSNIENILSLIENNFPENAEKISILSFVNWHNILNHAALEKLEEKEILFGCSLILELASQNFKIKNENIEDSISSLKKVSLEESLDFLESKDEEEDL